MWQYCFNNRLLEINSANPIISYTSFSWYSGVKVSKTIFWWIHIKINIYGWKVVLHALLYYFLNIHEPNIQKHGLKSVFLKSKNRKIHFKSIFQVKYNYAQFFRVIVWFVRIFCRMEIWETCHEGLRISVNYKKKLHFH